MNDFIKTYLNDSAKVIENINQKEVSDFINLLENAILNEKTIYIMGNGGSGALASHFVCDFNKIVKEYKGKKFKFICLNDNVGIITAYGNDESFDEIFVGQLRNYLTKDDLVVAISGSGNSKNVIKAIEYANEIGAYTFGFTGYDGGELKKLVKSAIHIKVNDMQHTEDAHLVICHLVLRYFMRKSVIA